MGRAHQIRTYEGMMIEMTANEILKQVFGYETFRLGQKEIIEEILEERDVLGIMPTGAGKSICFQVPALVKPGITLVISPLISLMQDQVKALNQSGVSAAYINSSLTTFQIEIALQYAINGEYKIIYVAPERLLTDGFLTFARQVDIKMVTVDEAHCISQWGQDFRPSYAQIPKFLSALSTRPVVSAFTATATKKVKEDIIRLLELRNPFVLITGFNRENLYFQVVQSASKKQDLLEFLKDRREQSGIIYCSTRKNVEMVCEGLNQNGFVAAPYHAGLSQNVRQDNQNDFLYDRIKIMVATNAFGMGIDKSNVNYVVHYNMPQDVESYYQEAGRAGRDGAPAHCLLLFSEQDVVTQKWMIEHGNDATYENEESERVLKERDYKRLNEMRLYSTMNQCLRQYILRYFGEVSEPFCGSCSNCDTEFETLDITETAQQIIRCVELVHGRYGKVLIVDVLRGKASPRVVQLGLNRIPTYGASQESVNRLRAIVDHLILEGYLMQTDEEFSVVKLTDKSQNVLEERITLEMKISQEKEMANSKSKRKSAKNKGVPAEYSELYDALRLLRSSLASEEGVPAFVVFADATLIDICAKLPVSPAQFANVSGVGRKKLEKYGAQFIEVVVKYCEENDIQTQEKHIPISNIEASESITKEMLAEVEISSDLVSISAINERINKVLMQYGCGKTSAIKLGNWLVQRGYLEIEMLEKGSQKVPTELGRSFGMVQEERTSRGNTYQINLYPEAVQRYIVEHVGEIVK